MGLQSFAFVIVFLFMATQAKPFLEEKENAPTEHPIIINRDSNMSEALQVLAINILKDVYWENTEKNRCRRWAERVAEKFKKSDFACFKYPSISDVGAYHIDPTAQFLDLSLMDPAALSPTTIYVLVGVKKYY